MVAVCLSTSRVHKPWGRRTLGHGFADPLAKEAPVGEIWFQPLDAESALMIKYLFTSEKLSIQVHPDDAQARARGFRSGKDEAWIILDAQADSTIALGLRHPVSRDTLRKAALDGSIETLLDWKPVHAGDVIYSPANTIHAIGAGITLIEVQQNIDLTYRLYDYGRDRALHLDDGVSVANLAPFALDRTQPQTVDGRTRLVTCEKFGAERWSWAGQRRVGLSGRGWILAVSGGGTIDGQTLRSGQCWVFEDQAMIDLNPRSDIVFASTQEPRFS